MILKENIVKLFVLLLVTFSVACKRDIDSSVGPALCASESFKVINDIKTDTSKVDFTKVDSVKITAQFNEVANWTVVIEGVNSGARKTLKGYSDNIHTAWWGEPDSLIFFKKGETCKVNLYVNCKGLVSSTTIDILKSSSFKKYGAMGFDFDNESILFGVYPNNDASLKLKTSYKTDSVAGNVTASPQGGRFFHFEALGALQPSWYFGGFSIMGGDPKVTLKKYANEDPSNIYVNMFINVDGFTLTQTQVIIFEGASPERIKRTKFIDGNFSGWKYVSFPLSDMNVANIGAITTFDINLGAAPVQAKDAVLNIDFVMLTKGKPFLAKGQ